MQPPIINHVIREEDIVNAAPREAGVLLLRTASAAVVAAVVASCVVGRLLLVRVLQQPSILQACYEVDCLKVCPTH
jgi:hypothetical protein